ncbi:MAG TPA: hypothetical protein VH475_23155 [Tepidisphaeraceae bacterium]|jgi:hypothetical protein
MSEQTKKPTAPPPPPTDPKGETALSEDEVREAGFFGTAVDETPDEDYTVTGVAKRAAKPAKPAS